MAVKEVLTFQKKYLRRHMYVENKDW